MNARYQLRGRKAVDGGAINVTSNVGEFIGIPDSDLRVTQSDIEAETRRSYCDAVASSLAPVRARVTPAPDPGSVASIIRAPAASGNFIVTSAPEVAPRLVAHVPS